MLDPLLQLTRVAPRANMRGRLHPCPSLAELAVHGNVKLPNPACFFDFFLGNAQISISFSEAYSVASHAAFETRAWDGLHHLLFSTA